MERDPFMPSPRTQSGAKSCSCYPRLNPFGRVPLAAWVLRTALINRYQLAVATLAGELKDRKSQKGNSNGDSCWH